MKKVGRGTMIVDPPWHYNTSNLCGTLENQYQTLSFEDLCGLPMIEFPADYLLLWTTSPYLAEGKATELVESWGFKPITLTYWVKGMVKTGFLPPMIKKHRGVGYWVVGAVEPVLIAKREGAPSIRTREIGVIFEPEGHSRKPPFLHEFVERCFPEPWYEFFARKDRPGWTTLGNEVGRKEDIRKSLPKLIRRLGRREVGRRFGLPT